MLLLTTWNTVFTRFYIVCLDIDLSKFNLILVCIFIDMVILLKNNNWRYTSFNYWILHLNSSI